MVKRNLFSVKNLALSGKIILVDIVVGLSLWIFMALASFLINQNGMLAVGRLIQIISVLFALYLRGYLINRIWGIK